MAGTPTPPLAEPEDLATHLGEAIPTDQKARAAYLLRVASARARRRTGQTWLDPDTGELLAVPDEVAGVVLQAAGRAYLNVEGLIAETDGDVTVQRGGDRDEAGNVYFTEDEERTLDAYGVTKRRPGLFTVPTTRGDDCYPVEQCASYAETDPYLAGWPGQQ